MTILEQNTQTKKDLATGFRRDVFDKMRELTSRYVDNYQTDLAVDIEAIIISDLRHFTWFGRTNGTCLICNKEQYDLYCGNFNDIQVMLSVDFDTETMKVKRFVK